MDCCTPNLNAEAIPFEFLALFGLGLLTSLGHCIGMCGALQGAFATSRVGQGRRGTSLLGALLSYHLGRILSYSLIGVVFGTLGAAMILGSRARTWQGALALFAGLVMLPLGLSLLGWLPVLRYLEDNPLSRRAASVVAKLLGSPHSRASLMLGLGNGLLPCGPVYTAGLTAAATGRPEQGALAMVFFGLGTLPVLLALGFSGGSLVKGRHRATLQRIAAMLVLLIGLQLILRGLAAFDLVAHLRWGELVFW